MERMMNLNDRSQRTCGLGWVLTAALLAPGALTACGGERPVFSEGERHSVSSETGEGDGGASGTTRSDGTAGETDDEAAGRGEDDDGTGDALGERTKAETGETGGGAVELRDEEPPVPGGVGELVLSTLSGNRATLSWSAATDDHSSESELEYRVYYSTSNSISSLAGALTNGTAVTKFQTAQTMLEVEVQSGARYNFNVVVRDEAGNEASYAGVDYLSEACVSDDDCVEGSCRISYRDEDGDGYGAGSDPSGRCDGSVPLGYAAVGGDCCDNGGNLAVAATINPGQSEFFTEPASICGITFDYDCSAALEPVRSTLSVGCSSSAKVPSCSAKIKDIGPLDCGQGVTARGCTYVESLNTCYLVGGSLVKIACH